MILDILHCGAFIYILLDLIYDKKRMKMLIYICMLALAPLVTSYSTGPPQDVCDNLTPGHGAKVQTSNPPFQIKFPPGQTTYYKGESIEVTLEATGVDKFKGFIVQARPSKDVFTTYGSFPTLPTGTTNPCSGQPPGKNVAIAHSEASQKDKVTFTWKAPNENVGNIVFVFSVVKAKAVYWVKRESSVLTYKAKPTNGPTDSPTDAPTDSTTKETTTKQTQPDDKINRDPACDMTIGCFPASSECSTNCDYLVTWKASGMNDVEFTLKRKASSNNYWIAVGFSGDVKMDNTSVTECVSNNGAVDVYNSFNYQSYNNLRLTDSVQLGLSLVSGSYNNGILTCTFKRKNTAALAGDSSAATADTFFSLTEKWYLLVAHGSATNGNKQMHTDYPKFSTSKIDFRKVTTDIGTTPAMGKTGMIKKDRKCGESLGCYHDCKDGGSCGFLLTWREVGDYIDFTLTCKRGGSNVYCAIGLSKDKKMGDDSVFECVASDGILTAYVSYNDGRNNYRLKTKDFGLSNITASYEDGILKCKFLRKKSFSQVSSTNGRRKRAVDPSASTYFDMNSDFNLLYAYGSAIGGNLNKHQVHPVISSKKADFQSFIDLSAAPLSKDRIILHGILMIFAWLFFASFGIFMASFYKTVWPEGMEWCGQKRWFVLHRLCMVTVFLLTVASAIIIFVHVGGYSEIVGSNFQKAHPILGIVVMCLATINPIMALFRPHPGTPKRPYFNFAHISVGVTAYVCGFVNIFAGFEQQAISVPFSAKVVMWVAVGWISVIELTSYIYDCMHKKGSKGEAYEMKDPAGDNEPVNQGVSTFKIGILCIHVLGLLALAIAASAIIAMGDDDHDNHDEM